MRHGKPVFPRRFALRALWGIAAVCAGSAVHAGRPLNTDDAGTAAPAQCQLEAWVDSSGNSRNRHLAPACGLGAGLELGAEFIDASPAAEQGQARNLDVKWVPEWATWRTWQFGLRVDVNAAKTPDTGGRWRHQLSGLTALASLTLDEQWALHLNAGHARDHLARADATPYAAGIAWTPLQNWLLFAEIGGQDRAPLTQGAGLRWWLIPDRLSLDAAISRICGTAGSHTRSLGLGWYPMNF
jgi:hypothetical protein